MVSENQRLEVQPVPAVRNSPKRLQGEEFDGHSSQVLIEVVAEEALRFVVVVIPYTFETRDRRVLPPPNAPVWATTALTASKTRFGRSEAASRPPPIRQRRRVKRARGDRQPTRGFPPQVKVTASTVSASENPCKACSVITAAITSAGTLGRPRPVGSKSANIASGNSSRRCAAKNANTLPAFRRCPATDSASNSSR